DVECLDNASCPVLAHQPVGPDAASDRAGGRDGEEEAAGVNRDLPARAVGRHELELLNAAEIDQTAQDDVLPAEPLSMCLARADRDGDRPVCEPLLVGRATHLLAF